MENSNKPSPSSLQDAEKKKGLAKKKMKIVKSPKKVTLPKNFVTRKSLAKKQADTLKNSATSSCSPSPLLPRTQKTAPTR